MQTFSVVSRKFRLQAEGRGQNLDDIGINMKEKNKTMRKALFFKEKGMKGNKERTKIGPQAMPRISR